MRYNLVKIVLLLALSYIVNAEFDEDGIMPKTAEIRTKSLPITKTISTTVTLPTKILPTKTIPTDISSEAKTTTTVLFKDTTGEFTTRVVEVPEGTDEVAIICDNNNDLSKIEEFKYPDNVCDYDMNCFKYYDYFVYQGTTGYYWSHGRTNLFDKCFIYTSKKGDPKPDVSEYTTPIDICRGEVHTTTTTYESVVSSNTFTTVMNGDYSIDAFTIYYTDKPTVASWKRCKPYTDYVGPITTTPVPIRPTTTSPLSTTEITTTSEPLPTNMKTMSIYKLMYDDRYYNPGLIEIEEDVITVPVEVNKAYVKCIKGVAPNMAASPPSGASSGSKVIPSIARRSDINEIYGYSNVICDQNDKTDCYEKYNTTSKMATSYGYYTYEAERCDIYTKLEEEDIPSTSVIYTSLCRPYTHSSIGTTFTYLGQSCTTFTTDDLKVHQCTNSYDINPKTYTTLKCASATTKTIPDILTTTTTTTKTKTISTKTIPEITTTTTAETTTKTTKTVSTKTIPITDCQPATVTVTEKTKTTVKETVTVTVTLNTDDQCGAQFAQCGGKTYNGPTCCQSGLTCKRLTEYFSHCI